MDVSVLEFQKNYLQNYFFWKIYRKSLKKAEIFGLNLEKRRLGVIFLTDMLANYPVLKLSM